MRIVREQMLCVISPDWEGSIAALTAQSGALEALFNDMGVVHFASVALLPPRPRAGDRALPSLMLEVTVDEGVRPADILTRLANHPGGTLGSLYAHRLKQNTVPARTKELLAQLLADLSVADGAFVGPRDRSLAQVRQERVLYDAVLAQVPHIPAAHKNDRANFAAALATWTRGKPACECANTTAPRSFWRARGGATQFIFFAAVVLGGFFVAWLASLIFAGIEGLWANWAVRLWVPAYAPVGALLHTFAVVPRYAVEVGQRTLLVLGAAGVFILSYALAMSVARSLGGAVERWFKALPRELDRPTDSWSARTAHAFMWLVVGVVVIEAALLIDFVFDVPEAVHAATTSVGPELEASLRGAAPIVARAYTAVAQVYAVVFFALLLILVVGLRSARDSVIEDGDNFFTKFIKRRRQGFHHPKEEAIPRAQQVHESIERCEAESVGGIAHMISLTELRRPYAWSAFWTRLSLRFVTTAGYILFTEGSLGNAPGIQFSHWHIVDRGRRLLFCANFDGTFGGYLDDFIKGPSGGTTLFWRWTHLKPRNAAASGPAVKHPAIAEARAFPPTRLIIYRGVTCELKFKTYARESMLPYLYRYVASPQTLEQKNRATGLRDALCGPRNDVNDDRIMRALES